MTAQRPIRVLVVVGDFPLLSETFVLDQVTGLIDRGFAVDILAASYRAATTHADVANYRLTERLYCAGWNPGGDRGILTLMRDMIDVIRRGRFRLAVEAVRLGLMRKLGWAVTTEPRQLLAYSRAIEAAPPPDVVLCHFAPYGDLIVRLRTALDARWPMATCIHGYDLSMLVKRLGPKLYTRLFQQAELLLPASEHFRDRLLQMGAPPERIQLQRMGVRAARDEATLHQTARSPSPAFIFIEVGRLVEKKGHEYAIRAFARCRERCGDIDLRLIIIGAGPLEDRLRALAHRLALDAIIEFRGGQPRDAIFDALVHSNVLLLPSVTAADGDMEASPVAISEAMSVGLPVIATHHGGIPEIVEDGGTGILVPERDVDALADAMERLVKDRPLAERLGQSGRAKVTRELDIEHWNDLLADRLRQLAGGTHASA